MKRHLYMSNMILAMLLMAAGCNLMEPDNNPVTYGESYIGYPFLSTDKACYQPGEAVQLSLTNYPACGVIRYQHLGHVIEEQPVTSAIWTWQPPTTDFQGYMAELHVNVNGADQVVACVAIDVSSDPKRFPRNGFLSSYDRMSAQEINRVISDLNRYHINYVQFQDWHWKHHHPLGGSSATPMNEWTDIISRNCYRATVQGYIDAAHNRGMSTLFYNLAYGALFDYKDDGVKDEWMIYRDNQHAEHDMHPLASPFKSSIFLTNTANSEWRDFLAQQNDEVYKVFSFDGWQIDQLGDREHQNGKTYTICDYAGNPVNLKETYGPFIQYMKNQHPTKRLVMNAVSQYGQQGQIASAPVDFCYTEVWGPADGYTYDAFRKIISDNNQWSGGKQTVLAAYLNYDKGNKRGYFNTPGIIMSTAVAMAWGGTILQLGEHMLCNEYFPRNNLSMTAELKRYMINYYDFTVAYENLLRPAITSGWYGVDITSNDGQCTFNQWEPQKGQVATVGRHVATGIDVVHLLSYRNATHLDWCDTKGDQGEPDLLSNLNISLPVTSQPTKVWMAAPDYRGGAAIDLTFTYSAGNIQLTLPALKYYSMLVIEY